MSTSEVLPPVNLGLTIGAALIGLVLSAVLFGVTVLQTWIYYHEYPNDWATYRYSVGILWIMDALHLSLTVHAVYHYLVNSFGEFLELDVIVWSFKVQIAINIVIIVGVQSLYAVRLWKLGRHFHKFLPWLVIVVVAGGTAIGILLAYETCQISTFSGLQGIAWAVDAAFASATAIDFVISGAMCYYLQKTRRKAKFSSTNSKIIIIMRFVLISGLATSACSMVALIAFITLPTTLVFLGVEFLLTKLYVNSFLAMLNARKRISGTGGTEASSSRSETARSSNVLRLNTGISPVEGGSSKNFIPLSELSPSPRTEPSHWHDPEEARKVGFMA
ncbi:hypothetical protein BDZ89DRAFT_673763 [Hymenopellis radicata]|nr:hypothetical protein BDZ89DRAFT_673763 [Hymenopellis radicata]